MGAGLMYSGFTYYLFGFLSPVYWGWEAETLIATTMLGVVMHLIERRQKNEMLYLQEALGVEARQR